MFKIGFEITLGGSAVPPVHQECWALHLLKAKSKTSSPSDPAQDGVRVHWSKSGVGIRTKAGLCLLPSKVYHVTGNRESSVEPAHCIWVKMYVEL